MRAAISLAGSLLLNVAALKKTGNAMSPVIITRSGFSAWIIVAIAFIACESFLSESQPPPICMSVSCMILRSRSVVNVQ